MYNSLHINTANPLKQQLRWIYLRARRLLGGLLLPCRCSSNLTPRAGGRISDKTCELCRAKLNL